MLNKKSIYIGFGVGAITLAAAAMMLRSTPVVVKLQFNEAGIQAISIDGSDLLNNGTFNVDDVVLRGVDGARRGGALNGTRKVQASDQSVTNVYPWGIVKVRYAAQGNRLALKITTTNTTSDTIDSVRYTPLSLKFPQPLREYDGSTPLLESNIDQVGVVTASFGNYTLAVASHQVDRPLMVGFPWALNRPTNTQYPLSVHTGRVKSFPDSLPTVHRTIAPGTSDDFEISLRFGRQGEEPATLVADLNHRFVQAFPSELQWKDHRPIGAIFLATPPQEWDGNLRGWFGDAQFRTVATKSTFRQRLLELADVSIQIMKEMNAQGAITWDLEGQQFFSKSGYVGDPRTLSQLARR